MMDTYLRQMFLQTLSVDMEWANEDTMHPPSNSLWGERYWVYEREHFYRTSTHS